MGVRVLLNSQCINQIKMWENDTVTSAAQHSDSDVITYAMTVTKHATTTRHPAIQGDTDMPIESVE
jgi:hypothetical protein